jgi:hypothetical protein
MIVAGPAPPQASGLKPSALHRQLYEIVINPAEASIDKIALRRSDSIIAARRLGAADATLMPPFDQEGAARPGRRNR